MSGVGTGPVRDQRRLGASHRLGAIRWVLRIDNVLELAAPKRTPPHRSPFSAKPELANEVWAFCLGEV